MCVYCICVCVFTLPGQKWVAILERSIYWAASNKGNSKGDLELATGTGAPITYSGYCKSFWKASMIWS